MLIDALMLRDGHAIFSFTYRHSAEFPAKEGIIYFLCLMIRQYEIAESRFQLLILSSSPSRVVCVVTDASVDIAVVHGILLFLLFLLVRGRQLEPVQRRRQPGRLRQVREDAG